ncbi:CIA30 family protein [Yoonia sp.]|uniref:CIA30 family protein n=1 Tax=Yoonia sp. TaxID=2212373 RepID=UPI0019FCCF9B|nr:CIA30 family protein [Yoonia sp.]MBE0414029.1 CIA30 family protein [Yoonia sp.]
MRHRFIALLGLFLGLVGPAMTQTAMVDYTPPAHDQWTYLSDQVMGGVSTGGAQIRGSGADAYLQLQGDVSTQNRGGFIQTRVALTDPIPADAQGIILQVRGNGETYFVHLRTKGTVLPWQFYQAGFEAGADWTEVRIPFDVFAPSSRLIRKGLRPESMTSLGFAAYGRDHRADLSARWIGVY